MELVYTDITLDFCENNSMITVPIKQGDNGLRAIRITLKNNGNPVTFSTAQNDTAALFASVGDVATALGTPCYITDNKVVIPVFAALSSIAGTEHCEVRLYNSAGNMIHTARFDLHVGKSAADSSMPTVIVTADIVNRVRGLENRVNAISESIEDIEATLEDLSDQSDAISQLQSDVSTLQGDLSDLESEVSGLPDVIYNEIIPALGSMHKSQRYDDMYDSVVTLKAAYQDYLTCYYEWDYTEMQHEDITRDGGTSPFLKITLENPIGGGPAGDSFSFDPRLDGNFCVVWGVQKDREGNITSYFIIWQDRRIIAGNVVDRGNVRFELSNQYLTFMVHSSNISKVNVWFFKKP